MTQTAADFGMKSEFSKGGRSVHRQFEGIEQPEEHTDNGSSVLLNAVKHLMGEDVLEERRRKEEAERLAKAEAKAKAAAEKKAREKRLRQQKIERDMERRQKEQEEAERRVLEEQRRKLLEEQRREEEERRKAELERAKRLAALREREEERAREEAAEARKRCLDQKKKLDESYRPTLYCFSLMMPFGYEPGLLAEQQRKSASIFACDAFEVFSNSSTLLPSGDPAPVNVTLMNGSLAVEYGGRWGTAMNTGVFNRVWAEVVRLGRYRRFGWTVKVDPDAVFFPERLRNVLRRRAPLNAVRPQGAAPSELRCGRCEGAGRSLESCPQRVRGHQRQNRTCAEALALAARAPPLDCGCSCDDFACEVPEETAMYINNCKWGLHGPIEIFSRRAVAAYLDGLPQCSEFLEHPWGEDKFIDQCMQKLNITRVNEYDVLSETACGEQPSPCRSSDVAFHPFKSIGSYFTCHTFAGRYGKGPEDLDCNIQPRMNFNEAAYMK